MDLADLIRICKMYADMGDAVTDQLRDACSDDSDKNLDELNPNALKMIAEWLGEVEQLDSEGTAGLEAYGLSLNIEAYLKKENS